MNDTIKDEQTQVDYFRNLSSSLSRQLADARAEAMEWKRIASNRDKIVVKYRDENERLRAELARIKPSWDDAPEWATHLSLRRAPWVWTRIDPELFYSDSYNMQPGEDWFLQPSDWRGYSERRPEGK